MKDKADQFLEIKFDLFFKEAIDKALANQRLQISPEAAHYLLGVLTRELRHDPTPNQKIIAEKAIAIRYKEVLQNPLTRSGRVDELRVLGDSSLVIAGMWWPSLIRNLIDVDYYIAIGSRSYQMASELNPEHVHAETFKELSKNFSKITSILTEATLCISIPETNISDSDIVRIYEIYLRSHNPFFRHVLRSLDINVVPGTATKQ